MDTNKKSIPFPLKLTNAEQRIFAKEAGRLYTAVVLDLQDAYELGDERARERAALLVLTDPNVLPALMLITAKRENPTVSIHDVRRHLDADEWELTFGDAAGGGDGVDPTLPPPSAA